jgi:hypothetical protein
MTQEKDPRAERPQRIVSLETLRHFWDLMARHFGDMPVDLSLFNYKAKKLVVRQGVRRDIPIGQVYKEVLKLVEKWYHRGEDILWRPAYSMPDDFPVSMIWLDDFNPDNELGLKPLLYIQTSPGKYQAYFKLTEAVPLKLAKELQRGLARALGDKSAGGYVQHRRMAGLANGKYPDDPLVIMFAGEEGDGILSPEEIVKLSPIPIARAGGGVAIPSSGTIDIPKIDTEDIAGIEDLPEGRLVFKPIVNIGKPYKTLYIKPREAFIKRRPDGTIDESATDMAWASHIVRKALMANWDEGMLAFTLADYLKAFSPELERRKKTGKHVGDYLIRTVLKAIDHVKNRPLERDTDDLADMF